MTSESCIQTQQPPLDFQTPKQVKFMSHTLSLELTVSMKNGLPETVSTWWDEACEAVGLNPKRRWVGETGYFVIELAKNALNHADTGRITAEFFRGWMRIVVEDTGCGFDNPLWDIDTSVGGGFGLRSALQFADGFVIESRGTRYKKAGRLLKPAGSSAVRSGARITWVKAFKCKPRVQPGASRDLPSVELQDLCP